MKSYTLTGLLSISLLLTLCRSPASLAQPALLSNAGTGAEEPSFNLLIVAEGDIRLKRTAWVSPHPTSLGTLLQRGDLVQLARGAKAEVLCDSLTIWKVPSGLSNLTQGCPKPSEAMLKRGGEVIIATRNTASPVGPYVISPRYTKVLPERLQLHWQGTPETTRYLVRLIRTRTSGAEDVVWEQEVSATAVLYPGPPLEPHWVYNYKVAVQAVDGPFASMASEGVGFTPLSATELTRVEDARQKLTTLPLSRDARALALALLYISHDLRSEAMQTLDVVARAGSPTVAVYTTLGHLARQMGLWREAETYYAQASQLARGTRDIESLAAIQEGLGLVYVAHEDAAMARLWFQQAQKSYKQLGDKPHLAELARHLARLPTP